jgi:hypothetical protein
MTRKFDKSKLPSRHATDASACGLRQAAAVAPGKIAAKAVKLPKYLVNRTAACSQVVPVFTSGGVVGLDGSFALDVVIVKVASMKKRQFSGSERRLSSKENAFPAFGSDKVTSGSVMATEWQSTAIRRTTGIAPPHNDQTDGLSNDADQVGPALRGTATHADGKAEVVCYADI